MFSKAKIMDALFSPTTILLILVVTITGYYQVKQWNHEAELETLNAKIESVQTKYENAVLDLREAKRVNAVANESFEALKETYKEQQEKNIQLQSDVQATVTKTVVEINKLADYSKRITTKMVLKKPTLLQKRIREATRQEYIRAHELTKLPTE